MKPAPFEYRAPRSVPEAIALLARHADTAKLLAGGQSLVPVMNFRLASPGLLIDLNRIPALQGISETREGGLAIGAMTRGRAVEQSELVRRRNPLLHEAMPFVAHAQIRNRGTIGGSLAHADPAAELPAIALVCGAELSLQGPEGERTLSAADFFQGLFATALRPDEILTSVRFPAWPAGRRHAFLEVSRRRGDFAIVGVATLVDRDEARMAIFGAEDTPRLIQGATCALPRMARETVRPRGDHHASAEYRRELVEVLTRRSLEKAMR